jgi:LysM domain
MPSLTEHLRRPIDHGRLPFHPECPVCREERLAGTLPSDALLSGRTPALLAAGVLALSTAAPATALAQEPEQEQEGATAPDPESAGGDEVAVPDAEPEWQEAPDDDVHDVPVAPEAEESVPAPDAVAPADEPEAASEPDAPPTADPVPAPAAKAPAPIPPAPVPEPETAPVAPAALATQAPIGKVSSGPPLRSFVVKRTGHRPAAPVQPAPPAPTAAAPEAEAPANTVLVTTTASSAGGTSRNQAARRGDRAHVVAPGESLWSIAADLLGDDASVAQTAREVNRLWELNSDRIGTGNPDLLMAGTRLALR